jgi:hypothetical protein
MHELPERPDVPLVTNVGAAISCVRLVDVRAGAKVRLHNGRIVVATGVVIQGARFVRPVLDGTEARSGHGGSRLGSMEVVHGDQPVTHIPE